MKRIDEMFEMYKNHLTGDEEDLLVIIYGMLEDYTVEDLHQFFRELEEEDKFEMVTLYIYEKLRLKMEREGIGHIGNEDDQGKLYH